ncbi:hypothetical protein [uncultured Roseovarius sp.]|uniref:hypothetical protein n=1 Tax=uncultured Roseovarius sp. TaxID=293344 RepID=UPI002608B412|nr:hypothetical protein [uncultured Roseovarius sp.]
MPGKVKTLMRNGFFAEAGIGASAANSHIVRDLILQGAQHAALFMNGRFPSHVAATVTALLQRFSRCVRAQHEIVTTGSGSERTFSALCANGRSLPFPETTGLRRDIER